ncbi:MAG TPA: MFS transporter [Solirubrobacteraceae bacterium]|nr:MFS transporter [Solirubrobacteraceae bacterium]
MTRHTDEVTQEGATAPGLDGDGVATGGERLAGATATDGRGDVTLEAPARRWTLGSRLIGRGEGPHLGLFLAVCCVAQFMTILDLSIVNVALPSIQSALNFSQAGLQWVVDAYAIVFAGFLMLGGRLADQLGQRRVFVAALALFALASLAGGAAQDRSMLTIARGVQGLGGALMAASSLAIITSSFPAGPKRHRAIGLWAAMNGAGGAAGTLFGGVITEAISWRWVLLINPPIAIAAALVAFAVVSDRRQAREGRNFDFGGALTLTVGQIVLVYGVVQAGLRGWSSVAALGPIIAGLVILMAFNFIEVRVARAPLIPFKDLTRPVAAANGIVVLFSAALFPMWFVSSLYLQQVLGLSPLHAGLTFLPMALTIMLVASQAGKLVGRFGVRAVLFSGLVMMTGGMLLFTKIAASGSAVAYVMIPGLLTAAGIALSIVPSTIFATQGAKEGQAGLASGLVNTSRQAGGGLGIALLITLATQHTTHLIGTGHAVPQALTDGFRLAYYIGAGLTAAAAAAAFAWAPRLAPAAGPARRRIPALAIVVVVVASFVAIDFAAGGTHAAPIGAYTTAGADSFVSAPGLYPPKVTASAPTVAAKLSPGYIFVANFYDVTAPPMVGQSGPLILDSHLQPVWFKPIPTNVVAGNLSRQTFNGKPALAWWQGVITNTGQTLSGEDVVVDQHYNPVARLRGANGWIITLHELLINGDHAWVTANKNVPMDLSKYGGAYNGALIDSAVQEYNIKTGQLLRTWDARDHIPLSESYASLPTNGFPWDAYHVNSINLTGDGRFVVSVRSTWAAYMVDINTGRVQWTLGGKHSSFKLGSGAGFQWQHDVVLHPDSTVTMFDDHCCQITGGGTYVSPTAPSRGLVLKLDQPAHTATLVSQYPHSDNFDSEYMGNTQPLPNGNVFVGWGSQPYFSEYTRSGKQLLDASLPTPDLSYRASREQWVGLPDYPPSGAVRQTAGKRTVYASWNGATQVASWRVMAGPSVSQLTAVATTPRSGFETAIPVRQSYATFKVEALNAGGQVIGASPLFK